jgi:hypothetical protein
MALPPVINGVIFTGQTVAPGKTIDPFSTVTISDPVLDATDSATILLVTAQGSLVRTISDDNGTLAGPGLTGGAGTYTLSATDPATLSRELDSLIFIPAPLPSGMTSVSTDIAHPAAVDQERRSPTPPARNSPARPVTAGSPRCPREAARPSCQRAWRASGTSPPTSFRCGNQRLCATVRACRQSGPLWSNRCPCRRAG